MKTAVVYTLIGLLFIMYVMLAVAISPFALAGWIVDNLDK